MKLERPQAVSLSRATPGPGPCVFAPSRPPSWRRAPAEGPGTASTPGRPLAARCLGGGPAPPGTTLRVVFDDPEAYERVTGPWSRLAGQAFLKWLAPAPGLRWLDIGCGSGVFTRLIADRCQPARVLAIDPQPSQIDYARHAHPSRTVEYRVGSLVDANDLPGSFDVTVMALVLSFLDDPALGVAQMLRVLAPGGLACAYNWDLPGGGSPVAPLSLAMRQAGVPMAPPGPSEALTSQDSVARLWQRAGLLDVQTHPITVRRSFASLEHAWDAMQWGARSAALRQASPAQREQVKALFRQNLRQDTSGAVVCTARAIAVRGRAPA